MKEVLMYQCDVCSYLHSDKEKAIECENKGYGQPIGKVGEKVDHLEGYLENDIDFPVYRPCKIVKVRIDNHDVKYTLSEIDNYDEIWNESYTFEIGQEEYIHECDHLVRSKVK